MSWIVIAYYTTANYSGLYERHASHLAQSLLAHNLRYEIVPIEDLGSWQENTQFKPRFIQRMMAKYPQHSVVYVDADAVFNRYPALIDDLDGNPAIHAAACLLDHSKYRRKGVKPEILSGTVFLKNDDEAKKIVVDWIDDCSRNPGCWDQVSLGRVLDKHGYYRLPDRYTNIFDYMNVPNPVITHNQASREAKAAAHKIKIGISDRR